MKDYLKTLHLTFTNPRFYKQLFKIRLNKSIKFFVISMFLLGLMRAAIFTTIDIPQNKDYLDQTINEINDNYPENLIINWDRENLTLKYLEENEDDTQTIDEFNLSYPSYISKERIEEVELPLYLGRYVNKDEINLEERKILTKKSLIIFTKKDVLVNSLENNGEYWQAFPLKELPNASESLVINKKNLPQFLEITKREFLLTIEAIKNMSQTINGTT